MAEDVQQRIIELVANQAGVDPKQVTPDHSFINDFNFDSLDMVELTMKLEDEFKIRVSDTDAEGIRTVGQAIDYVRSHTSAAKA